jgi:hypothetical protein
MHEDLGARTRVRVRGWGVASELAGMMVGGVEGVLKIEGVPSAAACLLLLLGVLFSSPSSKAADATCASCSMIRWSRALTLRQGLQSSCAGLKSSRRRRGPHLRQAADVGSIVRYENRSR